MEKNSFSNTLKWLTSLKTPFLPERVEDIERKTDRDSHPFLEEYENLFEDDAVAYILKKLNAIWGKIEASLKELQENLDEIIEIEQEITERGESRQEIYTKNMYVAYHEGQNSINKYWDISIDGSENHWDISTREGGPPYWQMNFDDEFICETSNGPMEIFTNEPGYFEVSQEESGGIKVVWIAEDCEESRGILKLENGVWSYDVEYAHLDEAFDEERRERLNGNALDLKHALTRIELPFPKNVTDPRFIAAYTSYQQLIWILKNKEDLLSYMELDEEKSGDEDKGEVVIKCWNGQTIKLETLTERDDEWIQLITIENTQGPTKWKVIAKIDYYAEDGKEVLECRWNAGKGEAPGRKEMALVEGGWTYRNSPKD